MSAWDDDGTDDDGFDVIETPPTVHTVTVNSSGTRIAVAHSKGASVYSLYTPAPPGASPPPPDQPRPFAPKLVLRLDHRNLGGAGASGMSSNAGRGGGGAVLGSSDDDSDVRGTGDAGGGGAQQSSSHHTAAAGVGLVALLYETNVLAVVGGGDSPCQPPNRVLLFNGEYEQQRISLLGPVAQVVLRNRRVIALAQTLLTVHSFTGEKLLEAPAAGWAIAAPLGRSAAATLSAAALGAALARMSAPRGASALSGSKSGGDGSGAPPALRRMPLDATNTESNPVCAFPDTLPGHVALCNWLTPSMHSLRIAAHQGDLDGMALTANGEGLITASDTNTVVRVWTVATGVKLRELRLGSQPHATFVRSMGLYSLYGERPSPSPNHFCPDFAVVVDSRGEVKFFYVGGGSPSDSAQSSESTMAGPAGNSPRLPMPPPGSSGGSASSSGAPTTALVGNGSFAGGSAGVGGDLGGKNQASRLSTFQFMSSYFASEWHCCSVTLPHLSLTGGSSPGPQKNSSSSSADVPVLPIHGIGWFELTTSGVPALPPALAGKGAAAGSASSAVKPVTEKNAPTQVLLHVTCVGAVAGVVSRVQFNASTGKCAVVGSQQYE